MKILMTADTVGGVWTYAMDLSAALGVHDIDVVLATMGPRPKESQRAAAQQLANVQIVESEYRLEWMTDPWRDVAAAGDWLLGIAQRAAVDVVHLNGYTHAALSWDRPVLCVAHSCVRSWWQAVHGSQPPHEWDTYTYNVARGLNAADRVIAPTHAFLEQLCSCYDVHRPAQVIRNGRACSPRRHDGPGERLPIVLACGRPWDAAKSIDVLDRAVAGLAWHAYVAGDTCGPDGQSFRPAALRALGALTPDAVDLWQSRASIFVHPACYEPFGLAVLEAAAAGCTLVLADIPSMRELWDGAAEFFHPRDSKQLRAVLETLIAQPRRRHGLAAAAQERAASYRVDSMAGAYAQVYQALLATPKPAHGGERAVA